MTSGQLVLASFAIGFTCRDIARVVWGRYLMAKFEREHNAAIARFEGCTHERTQQVNVGGDMPIWTRKCLKCWALELELPAPSRTGVPTAEKRWCPNVVPPKDMP